MYGKDACFEISNIEQIKGIPKGRGKAGMLGFHDTLRVPIIENTPFEEDLTESLEKAMEQHPDTYAVLVRNAANRLYEPADADVISMTGETSRHIRLGR